MSRTPPAWAVVLVLLAFAIPTVLFVAGRPPDTDGYVRFVDTLRRLREADETLSRLVLQARAGDLRNYDPILALDKDLIRLLNTVRGPVRDMGSGAVLERYEAVSLERRQALERFKTADAVFRNSLVYFPAMARDVAALARRAGDETLAEGLERCQDRVFLTLYAKAGEGEVNSAFARLRNASVNAALYQQIDLLSRHATMLVRQGWIAETLANRVLELSRGDLPNQMYQEVVLWHSQLEKRANTINVALYGAALLGIGGIVAASTRVALTNRLLDRRATELQTITVELRERIAEKRRMAAERDKLQAQLLQSQKLEAIGTLAGGLAHELNNMLSPILALTQLTNAAMPAGSPERQRLDIVVKTARQARDLVSRILTFSRDDASEKKQVALDEVVHDSVALLRSVVPASIRLDADIAEVPPALCDAGAIQQAVVNLVTNACHAIGNGTGTVAVGLSVAQDGETGSPARIVLSVSDNGGGMDDETLSRIFEPFFTTKPVGEGTGLGLAVVHGIVTAHGGRIGATSSLGQGATFTIELPALGASANPENDIV